MNVLLWIRCLMIAGLLFGSTYSQNAVAAILGQTVKNTASVSYNGLGDGSITVLTNTAEFVIEAERTDSVVEFFRRSPNAPEAILVNINGSDFSPAGLAKGPFTSMLTSSKVKGKAQGASRAVLNSYQSLEMIPAKSYLAGELMFIRVTDLGQNGDPNRIETITASLSSDTGDKAILRLYEDGTDTGQFWAFIQSSRDSSLLNDDVLTTPRGSMLLVKYVDKFDQKEVSTDVAVVDPYGHVFNALTGDMIDDANVTLINNATGEPAVVYGVDGFSAFPSSIMSGRIVTDESGLEYPLRTGEFIFPIVPRGDYSLHVDTPEGLSFASVLSAEHFKDLENAPFIIGEASYGRVFNHDLTGTINIDIPLDAESQFVLSKTVSRSTASIGDFVEYTVSIDNRGKAGAPVVLHDALPHGFKYVQGSSRIDSISYVDPYVAVNGNELTYHLGVLRVGETRELHYVLEIGAGAGTGEAVNSVVAVDGNEVAVSNVSRAVVTLREDLMRSHSTLIGRIAEEACDGADQWARDIQKGTGVSGVRLYMETGAYAISDEHGQYHFEGVTEGAHVVQIDEETLPKGYTPMVCEESSRYAGSAISKFVDVQGGGLWHANFYLKKTGEVEEKIEKVVFSDQTEYKNYDTLWLAQQTPEAAWVYPSVERTPSTPSVNIGIKHGPNQNVELALNGHKVSRANFSARDSDAARRVLMSRWRGVDLLEGKNTFTVDIVNAAGQTVHSFNKDVHFVKNIARAIALPDQSVLVADGRTRPELAVRLEDEAGRPVHMGRITKIDIPAPYHLYNSARLEGSKELVAPLSARTDIVVGADGIARITLEPTLKTGKVTIVVTLDDGRKVLLFMYLEPEKRDWILVGLAEGSTAYNSLSNKAMALAAGAHDDLHTDGRVAFFAKGLIKGDWLLTLAVDTDKRRGSRDKGFETEIDPNAYYTLYGDRSYTELEAASRYPVYVKLEKKSFSAMFGDYDTNITEGKLTRYSRHLSGFKAEYLGSSFQSIGYAAETNQGFAKDELAANGSSGPYQLSHVGILANSETIVLETRDRVRPDLILESRTFIRHLDYTLDIFSGEIVFRLPVDVSDSGFNPNVIVVNYETSQDAERNLSYGGRVQKQIMNGKVQIGSTFVHEGGNGNVANSKSDMIGAEIIAQVGAGTEVRAEYAMSLQNATAANSKRRTSNAYLAEIVHTSETFNADAYVRQEEAGFGLAQRNTNTSDIRRFGANVAYEFQEFENKKTGRRGHRNVKASLFHEDNLGTGNSRTLSEITLGQEADVLSASAGLRQVKDEIVNGVDRLSVLALASAKYNWLKHGAVFQVSHEQPLGGHDGVSDHPRRTRFSVDKTITQKASVRLSHDVLGGGASNVQKNAGQNTSIGVSFAPWAGTELTAGSDMMLSESGRRIGATVGLDQQFQINERWSASAGLTNRRILNATGIVEVVTPDAAISPLEVNETFTSLYAGLGYRTGATSGSARIEAREAANSSTYSASVALARELSENLSFAGAIRAGVQDSAVNGTGGLAGQASRIDGRFGLAWRPRNDGFVFLNRFDVSYNDTITNARTIKLVDNITANAQITDRWQLSTNYGVKYVSNTFSGVEYSGFTQLIGAQTRYDITKHIDVGLQASALYTHNGGTLSYAYGPSIGLSPIDNVWISLGYNVTGYKERDFADAEYNQRGAYVKFRFKFDQNTARGLLKSISPVKE